MRRCCRWMLPLVLLGLVPHAMAWGQGAGKSQTCKLESQKLVQGRERMCLYRCADKTLEGRTRKPEQDCPRTISSDTR